MKRSLIKRTPFKRRAPKKRAGHANSYLQICRGEFCYLRIPGICIGGLDSVVPCHSNQSKHGKGMGIKAKDVYTVPGCHACHAEIDQGNKFNRDEKFAIWNQAYEAWKPVRDNKLTQKNDPASVVADRGHSSHQS